MMMDQDDPRPFSERFFFGMWPALLAILVTIVAVAAITFIAIGGADARDLGQWQNTDPATKQWFETLMQPDNPTYSCCGPADGYWCDDIHVRDGKTYCSVTDDRPDEPLHRPHFDVGAEIAVPDGKLKWDRGNPTGHSIVFMNAAAMVFCFVQGSGT